MTTSKRDVVMLCSKYLVVGTKDILLRDTNYPPMEYYNHWLSLRNTNPQGFQFIESLEKTTIIPMYNEKLPKLSGENELEKNYQISKRGGVL